MSSTLPELNQGLSIVIPIYNEEQNIAELFKSIQFFAVNANFDYEFILVDGNSSDSSVSNIKNQMISNSDLALILIEMDERCGYGHDIVAGLEASKLTHLAWTHADLQTDLNDLIIGYDLAKNAASDILVKGNRKNRSFLSESLTFGMQIYVRLRLGVYLNDINAQPKIFSRNFFGHYLTDEPPNDFSLDLHLLLKAKKNFISIIEFDVEFKNRFAGNAKGGGGSWKNRINLIKRTVKYINQLST